MAPSPPSLSLPNCQHVQNLSAVWKFLCCGTLDGSVCLSGRLSAKLGILRHFDERLKRFPTSPLKIPSPQNWCCLKCFLAVITSKFFSIFSLTNLRIFVLASSERTLDWIILPPGNPIGPDRGHIHNSAVSHKREREREAGKRP